MFSFKRTIIITGFSLFIIILIFCHFNFFNFSNLKIIATECKQDIQYNILCPKLLEIYKDIDLQLQSTFHELLRGIQCPVNDLLSSTENSKLKKKQIHIVDVCPEVYIGKGYGYNSYLKGFVHTKCQNENSLPSIVTVIINLIGNKMNISKLIRNIETEYPGVQIIMSSENEVPYTTRNVKIITKSSNSSFGEIWNDLIKRVATPYVFIAENIEDFTSHSRLKRQIGVLSYLDNVGVVSGAIRDEEGNWIYNCYQSKMSNYVLTYEEGYYHSKNECMVCDHIEGPFMAKTSILQKIQLNKNLHKNLFADFFLTLKIQNILILSCTDVMNFVNNFTNNNKIDWLPIAKKWILNRIVLSDKTIYSFNCKEINIHCDPFSTGDQYLLPLCCLEEMVEAIIAVTKFCEKSNITFQMDGGSLLGAVKLYGPMPWDLDADVVYQDYRYKDLKSNLFKLGYKLDWAKNKTICCFNGSNVTVGDFDLLVYPHYYIAFDSYNFPPGYISSPKKQTKIKFGNYYIYGPTNPGLFVRNWYGRNILKHSVSWYIRDKKKSVLEPYHEAGVFPVCKSKISHACMDKFFPDGNIQFKYPES